MDDDVRLDVIEQRLDLHDSKIARLEDSIATLRADVAVIRASMSSLATKADLSDMLNGILRDALNAVPQKQALLWAAASFLIGAVTLAVMLHL